MSQWSRNELDTIAAAEELEIMPLRSDGTPRKPVTIWVVRVGDDLYIRSYRGAGAAWFRAARASRAGRVRAGGLEKDVALVEETDPAINDQIDAAYRTKYRHYLHSYVPPMITATARATTLRLVPR